MDEQTPPTVRRRRKRVASKFRQADLKRALKAATDAGLNVTGFKVEPETGKITIETGEHPAQPEASPLKEWLAKRHASTSS